MIFNGIETNAKLYEKYRDEEIKARIQTETHRINVRLNNDEEDVVTRLYHYKDLYDERKLERQRKEYDQVILH